MVAKLCVSMWDVVVLDLNGRVDKGLAREKCGQRGCVG